MPAPNGLDHDTLRAIAERFPPYRAEGQGYRCRCPVHDDHEPSLDIVMGDKGSPVAICRAGCDQGQVWAAVRPPRQPKPAARRIVAVYPYPDERGVVLYEVVRFDPKDFRQRLPDGTWKLGNTRRVLYRLPEIVAADEVVVVEGEKAADRLAALGVAATCSPGGAGKWRKAYSPTLKGKAVLILPDNDEPGRKHGRDVAASLAGIAKSLRVLELPGLPDKGDVADWLEQGHTLEELTALARAMRDHVTRAGDTRDVARAPDARDARAHEDWTAKLKTKGDSFAKNDLNIRVALLNAPDLQGRLRLNQLTEQVECRAMPWSEGDAWTPWLDTDDVMLAEWLQGHDVEVKAGQCGPCVASVARFNPHHPVRVYLAGLEWDGVPRLSLWLTTYLGAYDAPPEYIHAVGRAWLISLVARAVRPGCQVDHLLILEGPQGARKSSALRALVPDPAWFTDNISALGTKDSAQDLRGKWLIELSDLSAMKRTEVERIKAAISHPVDHYRPSYGRYSRDFPRQCVFAGTTNEHAYLFDSTGNRRFWCLKVGRIDLDALKRDRGQLWAEARAAFDAGEKWHLEPAVELLAATEQAKRREEEPLTGPVLDWMAQTTATEVHIVDIMRGIGIADPAKHTKAEAMRISAILRDAGYARRHTKRGSAWRVTPAEVSPEVSPGVVTTSPNDSNDFQKGDTSYPVLPQTLHAPAHDPRASRARAHAHAHRVWPENDFKVSPAAKPLKANGELVTTTSVTPVVTPAWTDWIELRRRCTRDPDAHKAWLAAAGGTVAADIARLPEGLEPGKALDWLEATLASAGLEVRRMRT